VSGRQWSWRVPHGQRVGCLGAKDTAVRDNGFANPTRGFTGSVGSRRPGHMNEESWQKKKGGERGAQAHETRSTDGRMSSRKILRAATGGVRCGTLA